jgi:uncharacterized protein DUF3168
MLPSLHRALYAYLTLHAPLAALVGTRLYPSIAPSSAAFPYVTVQRLAVGSIYHMGGASATADTLAQVEAWALSGAEAQQVAKVIRLSLDGFTGLWDGLEIDGVFVENELDDAEPADDGSVRLFYRTILTLACWHERAVPTF